MKQSHSFLDIFSGDFSKPVVAIIGGGGKTSLMFQLGEEFANQNIKALLTSITNAGPTKKIPMTLTGSTEKIALWQLFKSQNPVYILKKQIRADKYKGISVIQLESFLPDADVTLFECDGSRNLPLKAHSEWDPVVPGFATHVIIVIGADVINTKLKDRKVHRPEIFKSLWSIDDATVIDIELITEVVTSQKGYLSKIPSSIPTIYFVNKADAYPENACSLGESISLNTSSSVYIGSVKKTWWELIS